MYLGVFYIFLCFVVGMLGRRTYLGLMNFIFSIFFTLDFPLIYILIASNKVEQEKNTFKIILPHCNNLFNCFI